MMFTRQHLCSNFLFNKVAYLEPLEKKDTGTGRGYSRKWWHACGITKKRQESPVKGYNCGFLPLIFPNLGHLELYTPPKRHVFLEILIENTAFHFSKRALRAGTARNKWFKKSPDRYFPYFCYFFQNHFIGELLRWTASAYYGILKGRASSNLQEEYCFSAIVIDHTQILQSITSTITLVKKYFQALKDCCQFSSLTFSWWRSLLYRNQSINVLCKSINWFLYDTDFRHEILKGFSGTIIKKLTQECTI